ncbi:MAG: hypothetical protein R2745_22560 [Vicinamibacterales bacterium]
MRGRLAGPIPNLVVGTGDYCIAMPIGREKEVTVVLERDESFHQWSSGDDTKHATFTVDSDVVRVKLSALVWRPTQ